ncbi:MAG: UbiA family prenyltransferase [Candidatus Thermoplasmatota archaeon]|nr:UbiA family prenyltransferase [Candidatus Thermoplasmatota archaeon]
MSKENLKEKIAGVFCLIRPFTLLAPLIVSTSIMSASFFYYRFDSFFFSSFLSLILPASVSLALLNGASNALNQATDKEADCVSKPYRPIPKGLISPKGAWGVAAVLYLFALYLASMVHIVFLVFTFAITFFTVTYSIPPRLKDVLWWNQLWIAIPRGFLGILASWSVFGNVLEPLPLIIGCVAGLFLFGGSITKDVTDRVADQAVGTRTLVNRYGVKKAALFSLPFLFFPFLLIAVFINLSIIEPMFWVLTFFAIPGFVIFWLLVQDEKPSRFFENTAAWSVMYLTYFLFASCFSVVTIVSSIW